LIDEGLIEEVDHSADLVVEIKRGRPTVQLALQPQAIKVVAAKISLEGIDSLISDYAGQVIAEHHSPMPSGLRSTTESTEIAIFIASHIRELLSLAQLTPSQIARVGIAAQGHTDLDHGTLVWSPALKARNISLAQPLQTMLGIPCQIANDANMIAEGLMARDPGLYGQHTACVFIGHGVGLGLIIGGKVYHGATGAAAEFGHANHIIDGALCLCGRRGCLEAYAGGYAIVRRARGLTDDKLNWTEIDANDIAAVEQLARSGNKAARRAFEDAGTALGYGVGRLIAMLNPQRVVLGGALISAADLLDKALRTAISESVVESLRQNVTLEYSPVVGDIILLGTTSVLLREVDLDLAAGTLNARKLG
jgi:predicted NBD/HSP70 family sugar kinase